MNVVTEAGYSLVHIAAAEGTPDIIRSLVSKYNINVNSTSPSGVTPLMVAHSPDNVRVLIELGANIKATDKIYRTALHCAAEDGRASVIKALVEAGADLEACDRHRGTPLLNAALKSKHESVC